MKRSINQLKILNTDVDEAAHEKLQRHRTTFFVNVCMESAKHSN
jgi:ribosomal protein L32